MGAFWVLEDLHRIVLHEGLRRCNFLRQPADPRQHFSHCFAVSDHHQIIAALERNEPTLSVRVEE